MTEHDEDVCYKFYSYEWSIENVNYLSSSLKSPPFPLCDDGKNNLIISIALTAEETLEVEINVFSNVLIEDNCFELAIIDKLGNTVKSTHGSMLEVEELLTEKEEKLTLSQYEAVLQKAEGTQEDVRFESKPWKFCDKTELYKENETQEAISSVVFGNFGKPTCHDEKNEKCSFQNLKAEEYPSCCFEDTLKLENNHQKLYSSKDSKVKYDTYGSDLKSKDDEGDEVANEAIQINEIKISTPDNHDAMKTTSNCQKNIITDSQMKSDDYKEYDKLKNENENITDAENSKLEEDKFEECADESQLLQTFIIKNANNDSKKDISKELCKYDDALEGITQKVSQMNKKLKTMKKKLESPEKIKSSEVDIECTSVSSNSEKEINPFLTLSHETVLKLEEFRDEILKDSNFNGTDTFFESEKIQDMKCNLKEKQFSEKIEFVDIDKCIFQNSISLRCNLGLKFKRSNIIFSPTSSFNFQNCRKSSVSKSLQNLSKDMERIFLRNVSLSDILEQATCKNFKAHKALLYCRCPILFKNLKENEQKLQATEQLYDDSKKVKFCLEHTHKKQLKKSNLRKIPIEDHSESLEHDKDEINSSEYSNSLDEISSNSKHLHKKETENVSDSELQCNSKSPVYSENPSENEEIDIAPSILNMEDTFSNSSSICNSNTIDNCKKQIQSLSPNQDDNKPNSEYKQQNSIVDECKNKYEDILQMVFINNSTFDTEIKYQEEHSVCSDNSFEGEEGNTELSLLNAINNFSKSASDTEVKFNSKETIFSENPAEKSTQKDNTEETEFENEIPETAEHAMSDRKVLNFIPPSETVTENFSKLYYSNSPLPSEETEDIYLSKSPEEMKLVLLEKIEYCISSSPDYSYDTVEEDNLNISKSPHHSSEQIDSSVDEIDSCLITSETVSEIEESKSSNDVYLSRSPEEEKPALEEKEHCMSLSSDYSFATVEEDNLNISKSPYDSSEQIESCLTTSETVSEIEESKSSNDVYLSRSPEEEKPGLEEKEHCMSLSSDYSFATVEEDNLNISKSPYDSSEQIKGSVDEIESCLTTSETVSEIEESKSSNDVYLSKSLEEEKPALEEKEHCMSLSSDYSFATVEEDNLNVSKSPYESCLTTSETVSEIEESKSLTDSFLSEDLSDTDVHTSISKTQGDTSSDEEQEVSSKLYKCSSTNNESILPVKEIDPHALFWILWYIYSGTLDLSNKFLFEFTSFRVYMYAKKYNLKELATLLAPLTMKIHSTIKIEKCSFSWTIENYTKCVMYTSPLFRTYGNKVSWCIHLFCKGTNTILVRLVKNGNLKSNIQFNLTLSIAQRDDIRIMKSNTHLLDSEDAIYLSDVSFNLDELRIRLDDIESITIYCDIVLKFECSTDDIETIYPNISQESILMQLSRDLHFLFTSKRFSDVCLRVGDQHFYAHRFILSARSPRFATMLKTTDQNIFTMEDIDALTLQSLLNFIYTADVKDEAKNHLLYKAAVQYSLSDLKEICRSYILKKLPGMDVCDILIMAHQNGDTELKSLAQDFVCKNASKILLSESGQNLLINHTDIAKNLLNELSYAYHNWICR